MKKIFALFLCLWLSGCAGVQLTPEMQRISSVSDTSKCTFITNFTVTTEPHNMMQYVQYNTSVLGGDAYKILATTNQKIGRIDGFLATTFEVYKCK